MSKIERSVLESDGRIRDAMLLGLTFAAGVVDAVSFLGLGTIFTANMTGNTVLLALAVGQRNLLPAVRSVDALVGFSVGAIIAGRILGRIKDSQLWPPRVTWVLSVELGLLGLFNLGWVLASGNPTGQSLYVLIGLSAVAMGLQNAGARHLAIPGITTTVATTALTGFMAEFAALGISGPSQKRWAAAVLALFAGAALGAVLLLTFRDVPPFLTTVTVAGTCAMAFKRFGFRTKPGEPNQIP
jgi:uncharacterized membrane protein YoaK (UPF0700 family)